MHEMPYKFKIQVT